MENLLLLNFGETSYFAKVIKHTKEGFEIETLYPVEGVRHSEYLISKDYSNVNFFESQVLKSFRKNLIFSIELVRNHAIIKQKLRELEFSLSIFTDEEQTPEKQKRIKRIFGETFFRDNFPYFEFTPSMVNYLIEYLEFSKMDVLKGKRLITVSQEAFLEGFEQKTIHSITNNK